jgi:hypothetical protein
MSDSLMTIRGTLLLAMLVACHSPRASEIQLGDALSPIHGPLPTDSAVLTRLEAAHPCQPDLPPVRPDADLAPPAARCTLISTALWAIKEHHGAPAVFVGLSPLTIADVRCIILRAEAYRNLRTGEIDSPRWTIELLSNHPPSLAVAIDRLTGTAQTFRVLEEFGFTSAQLCARAT